MHNNKKDRFLPVPAQFYFFVLLNVFCAFSSAEEVAITGTSVSINAPEGFTLSSSFSGLENLQNGSSITINELPVEGYEQLLPLFTDLDMAIAGFGQQGVMIDRAETYVVGEQQIPVLIGRQSIPNGEIGKYLALFRGDTTVLLTFNIFDPDALPPSAVETAIQSVKLSPAPTLQQKVAQLPFSFAVSSPFHLGDVLGGSAALLPSFEGTDPGGLKPVIIIVKAIADVPASLNAVLVSQQLLRNTQGFEDAEIIATEDREFGGGAATYLEAVSENRKIVQYLRIPPDGNYVRLIAYGERNALDRVLAVIAEIAGTVAIR